MRKLLKKLIKGFLRDIFWMKYGRIMINPELIERPKAILFICDGNICRSPFAQKIAKIFVHKSCKYKYIIHSAGLNIQGSKASTEEACVAAKHYGIDLTGHRAIKLKKDMIAYSDIAIVMSAKQMVTLKNRFPSYKDKIFLLPLFDNSDLPENKGFKRYNIIDPYGNDQNYYFECFGRIKRCVERLFKEIEQIQN